MLHLFPLPTCRLTCSLQVRVIHKQHPRLSHKWIQPHHPLTFGHDNQIHQCCESSASDMGSTTSHSQTSSATSLSVHLPLASNYSQQQQQQQQQLYSSPPMTDGIVQDHEGFSSAFGLMSLDDSEVLAGLGNAPPFFDNAITNGSSMSHNPSWGDGPTPCANPCDAPPANGKNGANQPAAAGSGTDGKCSC